MHIQSNKRSDNLIHGLPPLILQQSLSGALHVARRTTVRNPRYREADLFFLNLPNYA